VDAGELELARDGGEAVVAPHVGSCSSTPQCKQRFDQPTKLAFWYAVERHPPLLQALVSAAPYLHELASTERVDAIKVEVVPPAVGFGYKTTSAALDVSATNAKMPCSPRYT
jgi:hypothetical protein